MQDALFLSQVPRPPDKMEEVIRLPLYLIIRAILPATQLHIDHPSQIWQWAQADFNDKNM